jgi:hypothetical protein
VGAGAGVGVGVGAGVGVDSELPPPQAASSSVEAANRGTREERFTDVLDGLEFFAIVGAMAVAVKRIDVTGVTSRFAPVAAIGDWDLSCSPD